MVRQSQVRGSKCFRINAFLLFFMCCVTVAFAQKKDKSLNEFRNYLKKEVLEKGRIEYTLFVEEDVVDSFMVYPDAGPILSLVLEEMHPVVFYRHIDSTYAFSSDFDSFEIDNRNVFIMFHYWGRSKYQGENERLMLLSWGRWDIAGLDGFGSELETYGLTFKKKKSDRGREYYDFEENNVAIISN